MIAPASVCWKNYLPKIDLWKIAMAVWMADDTDRARREPQMDEGAQSDETFKPPYMSFQTFWKFIDDLGAKPLPPRIDRSLMATKSGTDQANLTMALTSFCLVDQDNNVLPLLQRLTSAASEERKAILAEMIQRCYVGPTIVAQANGTSKDLEDAFKDNYPSIGSPEVRRKSMTFYLHAARQAGLELSVHFPKTRPGQGAPGASRGIASKRPTRRKTNSNDSTDQPLAGVGDQPPAGDTYTVDLASGGSVSVVVRVNLFDLTTHDRSFVIELVDKLKGYPVQTTCPGQTTEPLSEEVST
jgi:hypothetical protein